MKTYYSFNNDPSVIAYILDETIEQIQARIPDHPITQRTEAEYNAFILKTKTLPELAQDGRYTSQHKDAEMLMQNSVMTQVLELMNKVDVLSVTGGIPAKPVTLTINSVEVNTANIVTLTEQDKITKLLAYKKELLVTEVKKQRVFKEDVINGGTLDDAFKHSSNVRLSTQDAIEGKALHITWLVATLGQVNYDTYLKDTQDVEYSTHLSEDEPA